ncbi:MAG: twin-arginine translocation signal domain-containing protein [Planctomycetaceae bacterium]|nr:twin-arginine translocation signal domain-containing protein [Planctomycetaceae bacterium]
MTNSNRRDFLKRSSVLAAGLCTALTDPSTVEAAADRPQNPDARFRYLGWQLGLSYQASRPEGRRPEELRQLLREMRDHGMNFISFMLVSYSFFDPEHDGFDWPVRREGLLSYRDERSLNAREETEFLGDVIQEAKEAGFHVQLMTNCGIWNPDRIIKGYPQTRPQVTWDDRRSGWVHCPDIPDGYRCVRDVILDALERYARRGVASYAIEYPGYAGSGCFCEATRTAFADETGRELTPQWARANRPEFDGWKQQHIGSILKRLVDEVHAQTPDVEIWLHTACTASGGRGHAPDPLRKAGITATMPYLMHSPSPDFSRLSKNVDACYPLPAVAHVCVRAKPFKNYAIPPKNPALISKFFDAVEQTRMENLAGLVFFNETNVPPENRRAVYDGVKRFV